MPRGTPPPVVRGGGNRFFQVRLPQDGASATLRFLTELDDQFYGAFHNVEEGKFFKFVLCEHKETGGVCEVCGMSGSDTRLRSFLWAYVYHVDMPEPGDKTEPVKIGRRTLHRELVNEPRVFTYSSGQLSPLESRFERHGTILDRRIEWIRNGLGMDTTYEIEVGDPEALSEELRALAETLPDLEDVARDTARRTSGGSDEAPREYPTRTVAAHEEEDQGGLDDLPF